MIDTGNPNDPRNPEHSKAMYPPPTTSVFPGLFFKENKSSLVIAYFLIFLQVYSDRKEGLPPVAITILSEVIYP